MDWIVLTGAHQLNEIIRESHLRPIAIFKHSTRCSISHMVKARLDKAVSAIDINFYYLDLIQHRSLSNEIAEKWQVYHESPQLLLIKNGECIYDESHNGIQVDELEKQLAA